MSVSLNNSFMTYANSMEGKSLEGYSKLSPFVIQSKRTKDNTVSNNGDTATNTPYKPDKTGEDGTNCVENKNNQNTNAKKATVTVGSDVFFDNSFLKTNSNKSYVIDGATFSSEEVDAIRGVLQNAVSPFSKGQLYYDYKEYAAMGIAESAVSEYAKENLTQEQADVVNNCLSGYLENLLDKQSEWIDSECYYDDTEGVGDTGEMNTYYGVRHPIAQWMQDALDAELAKFDIHRQGSNTKAVSDNRSAENRNGVLIYCVSNKELAGNIRNLFAGIDVTDSDQLSEAFKQYKSMMTVAYRAVGFGNTTNHMLNNDTSDFTKQVSDMKAVIAGVGSKGVNAVI